MPLHYQIAVRGCGPLLSPLPVHQLMLSLLNKKRKCSFMCLRKMHNHCSIVQSLNCRSITGRGLGLHVYQHSKDLILLCWNIIILTGFYKNCIERYISEEGVLPLLPGLGLVHGCKLSVKSSYAFGMARYGKKRCVLLQHLSRICPRPVSAFAVTMTIPDIVSCCSRKGHLINGRQISIKLSEFVRANGFQLMLKYRTLEWAI